MKTFAVAAITVRELLRRKVQMNLLVFGTLLVVSSYVFSLLTLGFMRRILADFGLSAMELTGTLLAIFLGASVVAGDVEKRVVYPILAKPVTRTQYVVGRWLGLSAALVMNLAVMSAALAAVLVVEARSLSTIDGVFLAAIGTMGLQLLVVGAVAVLFSSFTSTTLAAIFTTSLAVAGHLTGEMRTMWQSGGAWVGKVIWYLVPNLSALSLNEAVVYQRPPPPATWLAALYAVLYAATALAVASTVFERRDLR